MLFFRNRPTLYVCTRSAEYTAKYNLNHTVLPYTTYTNINVVQTTISAADRGDVRPAWELLYAH